MIELRHLRLIQVLAATGNMTAAAQRLSLTQSALSHQLRELEERLGVLLVDRSCRPLRLTQAGDILEAVAHQVVPQVETALERLQAMAKGRAGRLAIASECHNCLHWLAPKLRRFRSCFPEVEVDFIFWTRFDALPALLDKDVDLVLTPDNRFAPNVRWVPLFPYEMRLATAPEHPLAHRPWVMPQDLAEETLLVYPVERSRLDVFSRFLWPAGREPKRVRTVDSTFLLLELVALGQGVAALPDWVCRGACHEGRIATVPFGEEGLLGTLWAALREEMADLPYFHALLSLLQEDALPASASFPMQKTAEAKKGERA